MVQYSDTASVMIDETGSYCALSTVYVSYSADIVNTAGNAVSSMSTSSAAVAVPALNGYSPPLLP